MLILFCPQMCCSCSSEENQESPLPEWDLQISTMAVYRPCVKEEVVAYFLYVAGKKRMGMRMTSIKNPVKVGITTPSNLTISSRA